MRNFESKELEDYFNRIETMPYQNDSKLTVNVDVPKMQNEKYMKDVNDLNIVAKGKVNKARKLVEQDISINYADDVSFPISYKQSDNLYGLTSNIVINAYMAVRNEKLQDLYTKFEDNNTNSMVALPNEIDTEILDINPNDIINAAKRIGVILQENITEANFSKVDEDSFALTLNQEQTMTIFTKILEEVKSSKMLPNSIRDSLAQILTAARNTNTTDAEFLKVTVKKDGSLIISAKDIITVNVKVNENNIIISTNNDNGNIVVNLTKIGSGEEIEYDIDYTINKNIVEESTNRIYLKAKYSNIGQNNTSENYTIGIEENDTLYEYNFDTKKAFNTSVNIEPITTSNSFVVNDASKEYLETILSAVTSRIIQVNREQMEKLGLEEYQNPLIYATPFGYIMYTNMTVNNQENNSNQQTENQTGVNNSSEN